MSENKKTIEISEDLYNAIQELKNIFSQLTGQQISSDEEVIGILVSWFIESLTGAQQAGGQWSVQWGGQWWIIVDQ